VAPFAGWNGGFMDIVGPLFVWELPWRPPDLRHFIRTAEFRELQSAAASWIELQFAHIQAEATWLDPAGRLVSDYCTVFGTRCRRSWDISTILGVGLWPVAWVRCQRQVAVVYGFDGAIASQILGLVRVMERAGWQPYLQTRRGMVDPVPIRSITGHNGAAIGHWAGPHPRQENREPPQFAVVGPRERSSQVCQVHVAWATRTDPGHTVLHPVFPPPHDAQTRERRGFYQPVEFSGMALPADIGEFAASAFERHEHAVGLMIELGYYENRATTTRPHALRKRLVPKLW
jgi:hypothetical protein